MLAVMRGDLDVATLGFGLGFGFRVQPLSLSMYSGLFTLDLLREGC